MPTLTPSPDDRSASRLPVSAALLDLAPGKLPNYRKVRYLGDDLCVSLAGLAEQDQLLVRTLYRVLTELLEATTDRSQHDDAQRWQNVAHWQKRYQLDSLIGEVRELGTASLARDTPEAGEFLGEALHDVRGGALGALLGRLQLLDVLPRDSEQLKTLFVLARDHLKIMRNAILGLDEPRREADRQPRSHDIGLMLEKWHDSIVGPNAQERSIRMSVDCRHEGALTECCLESSAVDRIFYNLANNAARHCSGHRIDVSIFPVPEAAGDCLRFVLSNEVDPLDATFLHSLDGESAAGAGAHSITALFEPEVSSTGSGFGLTVVADFVVGAFGLHDRAEALRERYVGAVLDGRTFRAWFHWPIASNAGRPFLDDPHRPSQSLTQV